MTVSIAFHLRRRTTSEPAVALLVPSRDPATVLAHCARLAVDPTNRLFDIAGGFLLMLEQPMAGMSTSSGAARLRMLAPGFYIPVDADLIPALLDDEASGWCVAAGLVFAPDGRVLLFDREHPVPLSDLLAAGGPVCSRDGWRAFPDPPRLADRLIRIELQLPDPPADMFYRDLKEDRPGSADRSEPATAEPGTNQPEGAGADQEAEAAVAQGSLAGAGSLLSGLFGVVRSLFGSVSDKYFSGAGQGGMGPGRSLGSDSKAACASSARGIPTQRFTTPCRSRQRPGASRARQPGLASCRGAGRFTTWEICCGRGRGPAASLRG